MTKPLLSLVMIVKDEEKNIEGVLNSVLPIIDRWTIVDTGSTDRTKQIIQRVLNNIPGQLLEEPFIDFATTRNFALDHETESTFALMMSGDEYLQNGLELRRFLLEKRNADGPDEHCYYVPVGLQPMLFDSNRITRVSSTGWRYVGAVHEVILGPNKEVPIARINGCWIRHEKVGEDAVARDVARFSRDVELLEGALAKDPQDTRSMFYLAQTYDCQKRVKEAIEMYRKRIEAGGWTEEIFEAKLRIARLKRANENDYQLGEVVLDYIDAINFAPHRAEPLFELAFIFYEKNAFHLPFILAKRASELPYPKNDRLFINQELYGWKSYDLLACCADKVNEPSIGFKAALFTASLNPSLQHAANNVDIYKRYGIKPD